MVSLELVGTEPLHVQGVPDGHFVGIRFRSDPYKHKDGLRALMFSMTVPNGLGLSNPYINRRTGEVVVGVLAGAAGLCSAYVARIDQGEADVALSEVLYFTLPLV